MKTKEYIIIDNEVIAKRVKDVIDTVKKTHKCSIALITNYSDYNIHEKLKQAYIRLIVVYNKNILTVNIFNL